MQGSILIHGSNKKAQNKKIKDLLKGDLEYLRSKDNPDLLEIEVAEGKKSIGIAKVKKLIKYLHQKPFSGLYKAVVIKSAELMTTQAQNALLKTLEEPPSYAFIILCAKNKKSILPTVLSRCQLIHLETYKDLKIDTEDKSNSISHVLTLSIGERLTWLDEFSKLEKLEIIEILEMWIIDLRKELNKKNAKNIYLVNKVKNDLENTNINTKLALDYLIIQLVA